MTVDADSARAEQALRDAFDAHAGDPLPDVVIGKRRSSRPWLWVAVAVVVVTVVLALARPGAMSAVLEPAAPSAGPTTATASPAPTATGSTPAAVTFSALPPAAPGWRWVSARDVAAQVPASWVDRRVSDWCAADAPTTPFVDTWTGDPSSTLGCGLALPQFVRFLPHVTAITIWTSGAGTYASGYIGEVTLTVSTPAGTDTTIAEKILASMRLITEDARGCAVQTTAVTSQYAAGPTPSTDLATLGTVDSVVMCQHTKGTGATLLASSVISGQKITDLVAALRAAPAEGPRCGLSYLGTDVRVLRLGTSAGVREVFLYPNGCNENYLTGGTSRRELTSAVCQALALPPGTNGGCTKS
jgi:hypothetical protein